MLRADTGSFNRLLTSLGLLALGAALVIPYFFFRNTSTLEISKSELQGMTAVGRRALLDRQDAIVTLEPWVIVGAIALALVGAGLVLAGALRLRAAQQSDDEESELRRARARLEFEEMSPAEQEERDSQRAQEEEAEEELQAAKASAQSTARAPTPAEASPLSPPNRIQIVRRISASIGARFEAQELSGYSFRSQVRIGTNLDQLRLDGVFDSDNPSRSPDVLLDIRVAYQPSSLRNLARLRSNELIAVSTRYQAMTKRPVQGWLIMVIPTEVEETTAQAMEREGVLGLTEALRSFGRATLVREREITQLPGSFRDLFEGHLD